MADKKYTQEQFTEFEFLVRQLSSPDQNQRIEARLEMPKFVRKHGKEICDAMFNDGAGKYDI
jgi:hypothetical protein